MVEKHDAHEVKDLGICDGLWFLLKMFIHFMQTGL